MRKNLRTLRKFWMAVFLLFAVLGCQPRPVEPTPYPFATNPLPTLTSTTIFTSIAGVSTVTTTSTPSLLIATASASPTSSSCPRPNNWVEHIIRADETLYYLATNTGVTVDDVMKANCISSDLIVVGDPIYLPFIPPPRPTFPPPPAVDTACPSPFSCRQAGLPPLLIDAGAPGDPEFDPCHGTLGEAWLDVSDIMLQVGDRLYVYVCEFPKDLDLEATVELPNKTFQNVTVLPLPPNPDGVSGNAVAVVEWPALPDQPTDWYTLTVTAVDGTRKSLAFHVAPPDKEHILIVPEVGSPGFIFDVYFIYFEPNTKLQVTLYGEDFPVEKQQHFMTSRFSFEVVIDKPLSGPIEKGWTKQPVQSFANDRQGGYAVAFEYLGHSYRQLFWLKPGVEK